MKFTKEDTQKLVNYIRKDDKRKDKEAFNFASIINNTIPNKK